ncbi:hypothetical protein AUP68_13878 [Ilyonectria robusta]
MGVSGLASENFLHPLISERSIDESRPLKVIYIGAGVSGIDAAIQFPKFVPQLDLVIYEKNADVGGTWPENRYPGCACDVPAHSYQLSFESSTTWSHFYAGAPEILKYWQRVAKKYEVKRFMRFGHKCIGATWSEPACKWHVKIQRLHDGTVFEDTADVFMTGVGALNNWRWPDIKGLKNFQGKLMHSAEWDTDYDIKDKTVAVIGGGSSGIQIVPALQPTVRSMDHYVRGRTWIATTFGANIVQQRNAGRDGNFSYSDEEKHEWNEDRESYVKYRKELEVEMQGTYAVTHYGSKEHEMAKAIFDQTMRERLQKRPEIMQHLVPDFPPLCKRLTPGPGYLEALTADVNVIPAKISHIDETGITTIDGKHRAVDVIVCATGFDVSYQGRFPIIGRNGVDLQQRYRGRPESYLGLCSLGPNSGLGNGNLLVVIEAIHLYIGQILERLSAGHIRSLEPKQNEVKNFTEYCDAYFKRTVFSAECSSWYKSVPQGASLENKGQARVTALWPGSSLHAIKALKKVRWEDFEVQYRDANRFGWFGDGWTVAERSRDLEGLTWYLNNTKFLHESYEDTAGAYEI